MGAFASLFIKLFLQSATFTYSGYLVFTLLEQLALIDRYNIFGTP
jgi:hypothetical protein